MKTPETPPLIEATITTDRSKDSVEFQMWFEGVPGWSVVKMRRLEGNQWWFDLVKVGNPLHRNQGLGTRLLKGALEYALNDLNATNIGLIPHAVGRARFDLAVWYRSHGFIHERANELWMKPLS